MPTDIDALVLSNNRLSESYNVIKLSAPDIARTTKPGQFVMVRKNHDSTALLRRPFSVFETLFDNQEEPVGFSILNKRVGAVTNSLFDLVARDRLHCGDGDLQASRCWQSAALTHTFVMASSSGE